MKPHLFIQSGNLKLFDFVDKEFNDGSMICMKFFGKFLNGKTKKIYYFFKC